MHPWYAVLSCAGKLPFSALPPPDSVGHNAPEVGGLAAPRARHHVEFHLLAGAECLEPVRLDRGVVDEDLLSLGILDETEPLGFAEPLHRALHPCSGAGAR